MIAPEPMPWNQLVTGWKYLPRSSRRNYIQAAAALLHDLWSNGADLRAFAPDQLSFRTDDGPVRAVAMHAAEEAMDRPLPQTEFIRLLADWQQSCATALGLRDQLFFIRSFLSHDQVDPRSARHFAAKVADVVRSHTRDHARQTYQRHLRHPGTHAWTPDPAVDGDSLRKVVEEAESQPDAQVIKSSARIRVVHSRLLGQDVLIKRYNLVGWVDRVKYRWRVSRARRAWAAANTFRDFGIATPEPLGFAEWREGAEVVTSCTITRFLPDASNAYRWLKAKYRRQSDNDRRQLRDALLRCYLAVNQSALHHADTKLSNLLILNPEDRDQRQLLWIDMECVTAGREPTRHQVIRNLVQMNGSLRYWVPEADRLRFLRALSRAYPWVTGPRVIDRIRTWTLRRLRRELGRLTPPDGATARR